MNMHAQLDQTTSRDPFGLASLPPHQAPENGWLAIERTLKRRRSVRHSLVGLASAATIALAAGLYLQFPERSTGDAPQTVAARADATRSVAAKQRGAPETNVQALVILSQQLEKNLRLVRAEVGAMPAKSVMYQVELEDLVAQLDETISQRPDSRELWSQRVNLLLDLNELYQVQLRRDYRDVASL